MNIISRSPDNHRFLRISCIIELSLQLLKLCSGLSPPIFRVDSSTAPTSVNQIILQLLMANAIQILMNLISFLGFWAYKGTIITDENSVIQIKNEMYKNEFLLIVTGKE